MPNLVNYAVEYAEAKEQGNKDIGNAIGAGGIAAGFVVGMVSGGPIGAFVGLGITLLAFGAGEAVANVEDIWDDAINALIPYAGTDKQLYLK